MYSFVSAQKATFGGLLGNLAEAKVNRHVQAHQARWEYKKAKVGFLAGAYIYDFSLLVHDTDTYVLHLGGASLVGGALTGSSSSSSREEHGACHLYPLSGMPFSHFVCLS
jgi:hypothetical protein